MGVALGDDVADGAALGGVEAVATSVAVELTALCAMDCAPGVARLELVAVLVARHEVDELCTVVGTDGTRGAALVTGRLAALRMSTVAATPMARR